MVLIEQTPSARDREQYSPQVLAGLDLSPTLPSGVPYALFTNPQHGVKPFAYASLAALARRIHRDRKDEALQLRPVKVRFRTQVRHAVQVFAEHPMSGRTRLIGYAWISCKPIEALRDALDAQLPSASLEMAA